MSQITILGKTSPKTHIPEDAILINTTSHSKNWSRGLSPFYLGPCKLYGKYVSKNMENAWQFSKVYNCHDDNGVPTTAYFEWAIAGWENDWAQRYPMGKGAIPSYSYWDGEKFDYITARKKIYAPLYYKAVRNTEAYVKLREIYKSGIKIYLWDFDGYDYENLGMSLVDVINCTERKMGHAFILVKMLELGK